MTRHGQYQDTGAGTKTPSEVAGDGDRRVPSVYPKISARQLEILRAIARIGQPCEFGDIWDRIGWADTPSSLQMVNFDRASDALMRRGLIFLNSDNLVELTDAGRATYEADRAARIRALPCMECHDVIRGGHKTNPCRCHCHGVVS